MNQVKSSHFLRALLVVGLTGTFSAAQAQVVDVAAAEALLLSNKCAKCHSVDKKKDGPAYKVTASKYKGKAAADTKLFTHLTTGPTVEIDGVKEEHQKIKAKDDAAVKNLITYILSR
jgi:cytochrome c